MEPNDDKLLDHNYDGIQELDNNLPPWWLYLFYFSIVFAFIYVFYYHIFGIGYNQFDQYKLELNPNYERPTSSASVIPGYEGPYYSGEADLTPKSMLNMSGAEAGAVSEDAGQPEIVELLTDAESLANGQKTWTTNCVACHGANGEGGIGPNMTDNYWIHGNGTIETVYNVVKNGVPAKGMIPWKTALNQQQMMEVASYVLTKLQGTNPPNGKAPEGTKVSGE